MSSDESIEEKTVVFKGAAAQVVYELETIAAPVAIAETRDFLRAQVLKAVSHHQGAGIDLDEQSEAVIIAKFSDKKAKGKTKTIAKLERKIDKTRRPRYQVPLVFSTPEKKSILRRLKVLDIRDDRRFDLGSNQDAWQRAYGEMILMKIEHTSDGRLAITRNPLFSLEIFRQCGGILNARFWDLNLRYGEAVLHNSSSDTEAHGIVLNALAKEITSAEGWQVRDRTFSRASSAQTINKN